MKGRRIAERLVEVKKRAKVDGRLSAQAMETLQGLSRHGSAKSEWVG